MRKIIILIVYLTISSILSKGPFGKIPKFNQQQKEKVLKDAELWLSPKEVDELLYGNSLEVNNFRFSEIELIRENTKSKTLMLFYADHCSWSAIAKKIFDEISADMKLKPNHYFNTNGIKLGRIDTTKEYQIKKEMDLPRTPLVYLFYHGESIPILFREHTKDNYVNSVQKALDTNPQKMSYLQDFKTIASKTNQLVYTGKDDTARYKHFFVDLLHLVVPHFELRGTEFVKFIQTDSNEIKKKYKLKKDKIYYFSDSGKKVDGYHGLWKLDRLRNWAFDFWKTKSKVATNEDIFGITQTNSEAMVQFLDDMEYDGHVHEERKVFENVIKELSMTLDKPGLICYKSMEECDPLEDNLLLYVDSRPVMKIIERHHSYDDVITYSSHKLSQESDLKEFLRNHDKNEVKPDIIVEHLDDDWNQYLGEVKQLNAENIGWMIGENKQSEKLIFYYNKNTSDAQIKMGIKYMEKLNKDLHEAGEGMKIHFGYINASMNTLIGYHFRQDANAEFRLYNPDDSVDHYVTIPLSKNYFKLKYSIVDHSKLDIMFEEDISMDM